MPTVGPSPCCQHWCLPLCVTTTHPCHYISTFSWPLQLSVCIPLGLITTAASPTPYLWDLEVPLRTLMTIAASEDSPKHSSRTTQLMWTPEPKRHHVPAPRTHCHHMSLQLAPFTTRPSTLQHNCCVPPRIGENLHLPKAVHKVWKS